MDSINAGTVADIERQILGKIKVSGSTILFPLPPHCLEYLEHSDGEFKLAWP
jgi:hypothetical protein